ncbi:MAG: phage holin family protein [Armatimonadetes bacterium]|nr:phage holin family protein [Armatimonadota bacterium]
MKAFLTRWLASAVAVMVLAQVGVVQVSGFKAAVLAVAALAVGNLLLKPTAMVIKSAGCLLNMMTLGLFDWVVTLLFWILAFWIIGTLRPNGQPIVSGFAVKGFSEALVGAVVLSLVNLFLSPFLNKDDKRDDRRDPRDRREA